MNSTNVKPNRRKFLASLGALGVAGLLPAPAFAIDEKFIQANQPVFKTTPYLQWPFPDSITIRWITSVPCYSWVEYGTAKDALDTKAESSNYGLVQAYNTVNAIRLSDLTPGKKYYYRVCSKTILDFQPYKMTYGETAISEVYSFETPSPDAGNVSFLVFNDIHDRPESFPLLMNFSGKEKRDFVFLNGDMFNYQEDERQIVNHLLTPFSALFTTVPFFFSRGNHEARGKFARHLPEYFNSDEPRFYFSFQYGSVYAIVLDSGEDKTDDHKEYFGIVDFDNYRLKQAEWLKREVKKKAFKKAKYKIVFSHIPFYYGDNWHGEAHCREIWGPVLNEAKVDLLISGHTHVYGVHPPVPGKHNYPIVIGGGPKDGKRTIIKVYADGHSFNLDMLDDAGKLVGNVKI